MTGHLKVHHGVPAERLLRLKPHKLGRHCHKVPQYVRETASRYPRLIGDYFLRNYRISLEQQSVEVHERAPREAECTYAGNVGKIGFSIDRELLTEALECYYGGTCLPNHDMPPISTSEQRMCQRLGGDVAHIVLRALLGGESPGELEPHVDSYQEPQWEYVAEYRFVSHITEKVSSLFLYLDPHLVDELTRRHLSPHAPLTSGDPRQQLQQLPVQLQCVLASLQMPLGQTLELRVGDLLPIRLQEICDVQIDGQRLFRGSVFEEDGSLFLTSLESVKTP